MWRDTEYTGWGRVHRARGPTARPEKGAALSELACDTPAPAIGMRRSYGDACLNDGGPAIETTRLDRIIAFSENSGEITVEAGTQIGDLLRTFAPRGWMPPVMPGTGFATVGGGIAMDVHGKNHHHAGSFGEHITALTLITPDGPRTVTPADEALFKATVGGLGQTGPILSATFKLLPKKGDVMIVTERRIKDWDEFLSRFESSTASYSVGWIDATALGTSLGRGILEEGETSGGLVKTPQRDKRIPFNAPGFALSPNTVRAFNAAYWRRVPASGRTVVRPVNDFFFPLDKIRDWNRLYGKRGFHQFQCVVPLTASDALQRMLEKISRSSLASPLAVLKRMGPGRAGYMSFPMEGWTLAVDFPNQPRAVSLIRALEDMTRDAGGRLYFAKDALASPDSIAAMYPEHSLWREEVEKIDPNGHYATDLTRRLNLRGPT